MLDTLKFEKPENASENVVKGQIKIEDVSITFGKGP